MVDRHSTKPTPAPSDPQAYSAWKRDRNFQQEQIGAELLDRLNKAVVHRREDRIDQLPSEHNRVLTLLLDFAQSWFEPFPQYSFDGWVLGRMVREAEFKGGAVLYRGDYVLVKPQARVGMCLNTWETSVFSARSAHLLSVDLAAFELL